MHEHSKLLRSTVQGGSTGAATRKLPYTELHAEQLVGVLLESAAQAVFATNRAGKIVLANRQAEEMFDYSSEELLGSSIEMLLPEALRSAHAHMRSEYLHRPGIRPMGRGMDLAARRKDGSEFPVEVGLSHIETAEGVFGLAFVSDISQRKQLEQQLMHAQKMEAIGRLAGGVAHDFNNMLTVICGYGAMVSAALQADDPLRSCVQEMTAAADRAAALTGQLLAFSRRQIMRRRVVNLNELITSTEKMLRRLIGEDVVLELVLQAGLGSVNVDPGHIEQAIVNLVINSRDAMPAGGRITIETANVCLDNEYTRTHLGVEPGEFVMVAVGDTGHGMDADVRQRVFDPFFTTKEQGKGTGLGLSTVYGTVRQTGGDIWVYSEPGQGTTFKLYFPNVTEPITASPTVSDQPALRGDETILVAEDEVSVRGITVKMLEQLGYTTLSASGGAEALEVSKTHGGPIHLLLTDVVMPGMNGSDLANELARTRPETKVLYVSGHTESIAIHHGIVDSSVVFLPKPFSRDALAKAIRDVLKTDESQIREDHQMAKRPARSDQKWLPAVAPANDLGERNHMTKPDWGDKLVPVSQLDREHLELIAQVNQFAAAVDAGASRAELDRRLTQLIEAFQDHFDSEEDLMRSNSFPGLKVHADEHRELIVQMSGLRDGLGSGAIPLCHALVLLVRCWTEQHMTGLDESFAQFLKDRKALLGSSLFPVA